MKKLTIVFILWTLRVYAQETMYSDYLSKNKSEIDILKTEQWGQIKKDVSENQFIILGESHGAKDAQLIDFNLLKYLNANFGMSNYIAELDYAQALKINEYLSSGNEETLKTVFRPWVKKHTQWGNADFYEKIKKIRDLNNTLPKRKRIKFVGIDKIQDIDLYLSTINLIIDSKRNSILDSLKIITKNNSGAKDINSIGIFASNFLETIHQNKSTFNDLLGKQLPVFEYLIRNLSYSAKKSGVNRAEGMFRNYVELYDLLNLENEKLYGMWGYFHAHQVPVRFIGEDFASKLVGSTHKSAKKTLSIVIFPIDSKYNLWDQKSNSWKKEPFSYDDKSLLAVEGIETLKELTRKNTITLFKLDGIDSPFAKTGLFFHGTSPKGKLIGDFKDRDYPFQYVILMRNSDWLSPLSENF
jgi:hypothetical protein